MKHPLSYCLILLSLPVLLFFSCKPKDEIITTDPGVELAFSTDTVLFDTIFTQTLSVTKRLIVTNYSKNAVNIDRIYVNPNSPYSLIINGEETNSVKDLYLRGGDNIVILAKAVLGKNNNNGYYIVEDSIQFLTNGNEQHVKLLSWGRDANFHSNVAVCDEIWTNDKPHVILGQVYVEPGCKLTIQSGAEVYVHAGALPYIVVLPGGANITAYGDGFIVGGTLEILGNDVGKVIITDDRLEDSYEHRPGLWGGIQFLASSQNSLIQWAEISNATTGLSIAKESDNIADLIIENTLIRDMRYYGVYSLSADVDMTNSLITNCGKNSLACLAGGSYNIHHCTFAEYAFDFSRNDEVSALALTNFVEYEDNNGVTQQLPGNLSFRMSNSIVWGEKGFSDPKEEIALGRSSDQSITWFLDFNSNIVMTNQTDILNSVNSITSDPQFPTKDSTKFHYDYTLLSNSPAIDAGNTANAVSDDLSGMGTRTDGAPDIGAYEFQ